MNRKLNKIDKWKFNNSGMFKPQFDGSTLNPGHQAVSSVAKGPLTVGQAGTGAGMASGLVNAVAGDTVGGAGLSGALSGVGAGAMFGPVGMGVGAVVGGLTSIIGASKEKKAEEEAIRKQNMANQKMAINQANMAGNTNIPTFQRGGTVRETEQQRRYRLANQSKNVALLLPKLANGGSQPGPADYARRLYDYQNTPGFNPADANVREYLGGDPYLTHGNNARQVASEYARTYQDADYAFDYVNPTETGQSYGYTRPLRPINRQTEVQRPTELAPMNLPEPPRPPVTQPVENTYMPIRQKGVKGQSSKTDWNMYAYGGQTMPNAEVEGDEVVQTPQGQVATIQGPTHEQGGVDMNLDPGTRVYSDRLKGADGIKFSEKADAIRKRMGKFERILNDSRGTKLAKYTAKLMMDKINKELDSVFQEQESMKQQQGIAGPQQMFATGGEVGMNDQDRSFEPKSPNIYKIAYNPQLFTPEEFRVERRLAPKNYDGPGEYMYVMVAKNTYNDRNKKMDNYPSYMLIDEDSYNQYKKNSPEMVVERDTRMPTSYTKRQWAYTDGEFVHKAFGTGTERAAAATSSLFNPVTDLTGSPTTSSTEAGLASVARTLQQNEQVSNFNTGQQQIANTRNQGLATMRSMTDNPNPPGVDELMQETGENIDARVSDTRLQGVPTRTGLVQPNQMAEMPQPNVEGVEGNDYSVIYGSYEDQKRADRALAQVDRKEFPDAHIRKSDVSNNWLISLTKPGDKQSAVEVWDRLNQDKRFNTGKQWAWVYPPTQKGEPKTKEEAAERVQEIKSTTPVRQTDLNVVQQSTGNRIQQPQRTHPVDMPVVQQEDTGVTPREVDEYGNTIPQLPPDGLPREYMDVDLNQIYGYPNIDGIDSRQSDYLPLDDTTQQGNPTNEPFNQGPPVPPEHQFNVSDKDVDLNELYGYPDIDPRTGLPKQQQQPQQTPYGGGPVWGDLLEYSPTIYNAIKAMGARGRARRIDRDFDPGQYMSSRLVEPRRTSLDPIRRELEAREAASNRAMRNVGADATGSVYNRMMANTGQTRRALADTALKEDSAYTQNKLQADMFNVETNKFNRQMKFQGDAARRQAHAANEAFLPNALTGAAGIAGQRRRESNQMAMEMMKYPYLQQFAPSYNVYDPSMPVRQQGQQLQTPNPYYGSGIGSNWMNRPIFRRRNNTQQGN